MSTFFEAVVVEGDGSSVIGVLDRLVDLDEATPPIRLELYRVAERGFVVFGWRTGTDRPDAEVEMECIANELSQEVGPAVTICYDDQVGRRVAMLSRDGDAVRYFSESDEVWVPLGEDGEPTVNGPRYAGDAVPEDVECGCVRSGIDAAFESAGFGSWISTAGLVDVAYRKDALWRREWVAG